MEVSDDGRIYVTLPDTPAPMRVQPPFTPKSNRDTQSFVIIGGGAAAAAAVETLRSEGYTGRITMLVKEAAAPYDRTKLSKNMGVSDASELALRSNPAFYTETLGVTMRLGVEVSAVRPDAHEVELVGGEVLRYDKLLCATGGPARTFRKDVAGEGFVIEGAQLNGIFPLREAVHAEGIEAVRKAPREHWIRRAPRCMATRVARCPRHYPSPFPVLLAGDRGTWRGAGDRHRRQLVHRHGGRGVPERDEEVHEHHCGGHGS